MMTIGDILAYGWEFAGALLAFLGRYGWSWVRVRQWKLPLVVQIETDSWFNATGLEADLGIIQGLDH
jgi:hypothetical protein